jgi:hypothetical protein
VLPAPGERFWPAAVEKDAAGAFGERFRKLQDAGYSEFSGVSFPGDPSVESSPLYNVGRDLVVRGGTFGNRAMIAIGAASCDLSGSRFLGSSRITMAGGERDLVCTGTEFLGTFRLDASSQNSSVSFDSSAFRASSCFNFVEKLTCLSFGKCRFSEAPTFGDSPKIPRKANFHGATFSLKAEDESSYRAIRNFFATHRARDSEGRFYAYEKRCHRLGMKGLRELEALYLLRKPRFSMPPIPEAERTPLVTLLLGLIEDLAERVQKQDEEIAHLKDEVRVLKGQKKRPQFKPSKMDEQTDPEQSEGEAAEEDPRRPGSDKRSKKAELVIHDETIIRPQRRIPKGSRFKGYRDVIIQDLVIEAHNTRYRLARWLTPRGEYLTGELPAHLADHHFGPTLRSYLLYQHHHCQVTQPLLHEQLREWGIDISTGTIDALLSADQGAFHAEKDALLETGLATASYVTVDDTGARHRGQNGYVTHIGNAHFAWFQSTPSKNRINFLELLCAGDTGLGEPLLVHVGQRVIIDPVAAPSYREVTGFRSRQRA